MPHNHAHVLADYHMAGPEHVQKAIAAALKRAASGRAGRGKIARR